MRVFTAGGSWPSLALLFGCFFAVALWELYWPRRALDSPVGQRWIGNLAVYMINAAVLAWFFPAPGEVGMRIEASLGLELLRWPEAHSVTTFARRCTTCCSTRSF